MNVCIVSMRQHLLHKLYMARVENVKTAEGGSAGVTHLGVFDHAYSIGHKASEVNRFGVRFTELAPNVDFRNQGSKNFPLCWGDYTELSHSWSRCLSP